MRRRDKKKETEILTRITEETSEDTSLTEESKPILSEEDYEDINREFSEMGYDPEAGDAPSFTESDDVVMYGLPDEYFETGEDSGIREPGDVTFNYDSDETSEGADDPENQGESAEEEDPEAVAADPAAEEPGKKPNVFLRLGRWIRSWKMWVKILVLIILLILVTTGVLAITALRSVENAIDTMNQDAEIPEDYDLGLQPVEGFQNILLLGVDSRNMDEIKGSRSDMIMIASINTETFEVTLTSIYRDTYFKLGDTPTYDKITHACVYGGPEMTIKSINQAMDLDIEQYAIVNFKAVADVVDAVGGIEVDVQEEEIYQLNKYTKETAYNIGRKKGTYNLVEKPGLQTLEGVQAVSYGRIRKGVGDDYKRTERMRTVVTLVFEKMKKMSFTDLKKVIDIVVPQCKTNMKLNDILTLGKNITQFSIRTGSGFPYEVSGKYLGGTSYVFPTNLGASVIKFHQDVFGQDDSTLLVFEV